MGAHAAGADVNYCAANVRSANVRSVDHGAADLRPADNRRPDHVRAGADDKTVHAGFFRADLDDPDVWLGAHAAGADVNYCAANVRSADFGPADFGPNDYSAADLGPDHVRAGAVCPGYL